MTIDPLGSKSIIVVIGGEAANGAAIPDSATNEHEPGQHPAWVRPGNTLAWVVDRVCQLRGAVIAAWLPPTVCLGAVLLLGSWRVHRYCRESNSALLPIQERARRWARWLRLRRIPRILVHPNLAEPFLCGVFRTVIVLPDVG